MLNDELERLEQFRLTKSINYAVDAAVDEMINTGDLGMDYVDIKKMTVDPRVALDTFISVFLLNYDLYYSDRSIVPQNLGTVYGDDNKNTVLYQYLPVFIVAVYDGFYVFEESKLTTTGGVGLLKQGIEDGVSYPFVATPKLPYTYRDSYNGDLYALNLGLENCIKLSNGSMTKVDLPFTCENGTKVFDVTENKVYINQRVSDEMMYRLDKHFEGGFTSNFYIPYEMTTITSVNAIEGPTVLALLRDVDLTTRYKLSSFAIGGSEVENQRMIAAYNRDGKDRYAYHDLLPAGFTSYVIEMFTTPMEAAEAGYYHDELYMN
jgi:hypothetical protein